VNVATVILPHHLVHPQLTDEARFCLDAAAQNHQDLNLNIAVLSLRPAMDYPALSDYKSVSTWTLNTDLWPQDMANNHLIWPAMAAYQGLKAHFNPAAPVFFTPLREGLAYFILQAQKSGLLFGGLELTQTLYKPIGLETQARFQLPLDINPIVSDSLERWCAKAGPHLISTHEETHRDIEQWAEAALPSLTALTPQTRFVDLEKDNALTEHLIFIGRPSPIDGFDAFCDLAVLRAEQGQLKHITVALNRQYDALTIKDNAVKRLQKLRRHGVKLSFIDDPAWTLAQCEAGVIVLPARLPFFPQKLRHITDNKFAFIWGTGLTLDPHASPRPQGAYHTLSDVRRLAHVLKTGDSVKSQSSYPPPKQPDIAPRCHVIKAPKVSVIVLHKDRPELLQETLTSLKAQSLQKFELVLVDDGSAPDVRAKLQSYLDRFNFAQSQLILLDGLYPGEARNQGARAAKGNALFFMDDDNLLAPETLTDFAQALTRNDAVMSFYQRLIPNKATLTGQPAAPAHHSAAYGFIGPHPSAGLFHNMMGNSFIMIRKGAYEALGGYSAEYGIGLEDYAFMLRAADLDFTILPEPYLHFREHGEKIRRAGLRAPAS